MPKKEGKRFFSFPIIFHRPLNPGSWIQGSIQEKGEGLEAQSFLNAPKQGDRAMEVTEKEIKRQAKRLGRPVTHRVYATNKGSKALVLRTKGYTFVGIEEGEEVYEKVINP